MELTVTEITHNGHVVVDSPAGKEKYIGYTVEQAHNMYVEKYRLFYCVACNQYLQMKQSGGTGYGTVPGTENKKCYACIGVADQQELEEATIGQRFTHYLSKKDGVWYVGNWPASWQVPVHVWTGKHNIARVQYFTNFKVGKNYFSGRTVGDNTQICHITCIKKPKNF
jgi:hypothetical protein